MNVFSVQNIQYDDISTYLKEHLLWTSVLTGDKTCLFLPTVLHLLDCHLYTAVGCWNFRFCLFRQGKCTCYIRCILYSVAMNECFDARKRLVVVHYYLVTTRHQSRGRELRNSTCCRTWYSMSNSKSVSFENSLKVMWPNSISVRLCALFQD